MGETEDAPAWHYPEHKTYPKVPGIDEIDKNDPVAFREAHAQMDREAWVAIAATRLLRDQIRQCYMREGVNHLKNCKELVQEYYLRVKDNSDAYRVWDKQNHPKRS